MEEVERLKSFEYKATSNLVLTSSERKRDTGPSSEVTSLSIKLKTNELHKQFGDRVARTRPPELEREAAYSKKKRAAASERDEAEQEKKTKKKAKTHKDSSVLATEVDDIYTPQTKETRAAYAVLLNFVQQEIPDKPHDVLRSLAHEVLSILKDDSAQSKVKKTELEALLHRAKPMPDDRFAQLFNTCKKITDVQAEAAEDRGIDENFGVNVVFDEEEDADEVPEVQVTQVREEEDEEEEDEAAIEADAEGNLVLESKVSGCS